MLFAVILGVCSVIGSGVAALAGFGIGSLLTPVLALRTGAKLAVAAVAVAHLAGSALRCWLLRRYIDRSLVLRFGTASAVSGLAGALAHSQVSSSALAAVFGAVVGLAGVSELTGWMERIRWGHHVAWAAGLLSGTLGGLVGNQGGIRSAALLGFGVPKESFVATATAIGVIVDLARLPVYLATQGREIIDIWPLLTVATAGVIVGTLLGTHVLRNLPERSFHRVIGVSLLLLGAYMVLGGG